MLTHRRPSLFFILLCAFLSVLWIAGGASRADVPGQAIVRGAAWMMLVIALLFGERISLTPVRPVLILLMVTAALAVLQLVPLPPAVWQALPGRAILTQAASASGQVQPWRPWSITPPATFNSASSLIVPLVIVLSMAGLRKKEHQWLVSALLCLIVAATIFGLLQFSGARLSSPFVNDTAGQVSGIFANRNHLALFLALGCLLAPAWAFMGGRRPGWRGPFAFAVVLLMMLLIVAIGSRAGLALGVLAIALGIAQSWHSIRREIANAPRWVFPALIAAIIGVISIFVLISVAADRAEAIDRLLVLDARQDMRRRGLPTVLAMIQSYSPFGSGLGGFDAVFRLHEPFALLKKTYFNHAHNDFLEVALDAGFAGALLLVGFLGWCALSSLRVWRGGHGPETMLPRLGSAMLLLIAAASIFDYPARTPMIMAMAAIATIWLSGYSQRPSESALPRKSQHL